MAEDSQDQPVTHSQLKAALDAQSEQLIEHMKGVETRLLTAFYRWFSPLQSRVRILEMNDGNLSERLAMIEERISELERRRHQ